MLRRILLVGLFASSMVFGQGGRGGGGSKGGGPNIPTMSFGGTPFDRVSEALKMNRDQKKEFKATMDDAQKEATPVHEQILKSRQAIADAVAEGKSQDDLVKAEGVLEAQVTEIELRAFAKIADTLEEDQKPRAGMLFQMMRGIFSKKNWNITEN
jgi:hypothetical protein